MSYAKKYVTILDSSHYFYVDESRGKQVYSGIELCPEADIKKYLDSGNFVMIPDCQIGTYGKMRYIHFGEWLYKADVESLNFSIIDDNILQTTFLNNCIVVVKKNKSRHDMLIKINPDDGSIETMGFLQNENLCR